MLIYSTNYLDTVGEASNLPFTVCSPWTESVGIGWFFNF